jgi:hypothetical protein
MQTTKNYATNASVNMGQALSRMPIGSARVKPLPSTMQEITRYVEQLLTPEQEAVCDMATD